MIWNKIKFKYIKYSYFNNLFYVYVKNISRKNYIKNNDKNLRIEYLKRFSVKKKLLYMYNSLYFIHIQTFIKIKIFGSDEFNIIFLSLIFFESWMIYDLFLIRFSIKQRIEIYCIKYNKRIIRNKFMNKIFMEKYLFILRVYHDIE